jgi:hypothetical protein
MLFYLLGDDERIIEIQSLPESTIDMITPKTIHSPIYISYTIDCGKVTNITDTTGILYEDCVILDDDGGEMVLGVNDYFYGLLNVKKYRIAVLPVDVKIGSTYSGTRYTYFDNGLIGGKFNYKNGQLRTCYYYRNDMYNTLEGSRIHNADGKIEAEYAYDNRETLTMQKWYNSNETVFYTQMYCSDKEQCIEQLL